MAAIAYRLYIPRANFRPGFAATALDKRKPGDVGRNITFTAAQETGTRTAFVADTTLWSSLEFVANSPDKTVGRQVQLIGDAAWSLTHYSADTVGYPVAANTPFMIELNRESEILYVASASGSVNLYAWVVR